MITFDRIDALTASLEERLERFYSKTLADSARSLASLLRAKSALNSSLFRASELAYSEALYSDLLRRIAKLSGYTEKELRTIFKKAGFESIRDEQAIIGKLGLEVPELAESQQLTGIVNSVFARTNVVLQNLTRSIAYQSELQFIAAADDAYLAVSTGTLGIDQAIKQGVLTLAEQGVRVLNSQTGRVEQADVAIKRNIWTGINQATGDMTLAMAAEAGTDLVEVSAHPGARNKGAGPMNHASWQGKVYSISGTHPKYEPLIETTGYGTGPGLLGWNCRHSLFLFFEGYEKPAYTQAELDRVNNTQVTYGGKQMDLYEATQQQRYLERGVRDWKRKQAMFEAAGLGEEHAMAGVKIEKWQAKLRDFTKKTGLERRYEWEQVAGVKAVRPSWGKTREPIKTVFTTKSGEPFEGKLFRGVSPLEKEKINRIPSQFAVGEYWTPSKTVASTYGTKIIEREIKLEHPYVFRLSGKDAYYKELIKEFGTKDPQEITNILLRKGYDSLIVRGVPFNRGGRSLANTAEVILFRKPK